MTRLMYDAVTGANIPAGAAMVAGYADGLYAWSAADWARFPHAVKIRIAVFSSTADGHVLDCEPGNATPAQSVDWVLGRRAAGIDPTVYCGRNTWWTAIRAAFQARGVPEPHYWVADYSGDPNEPVIPEGAIGLQYQDAGPYDLSAMADYWPGIDPAPAVQPITPTEPDMILVNTSGNPAVLAISGSLVWGVQDGTSAAAYQAKGVPLVTVTAAEFAAVQTAAANEHGSATVQVTLDSSDLASALTQPSVLAAEGAAIAHAEAVQQHNETPAS